MTHCSGCQTEVAPAMLVCPACHKLVHGEEVSRLVDSAEAHAASGDGRAALADWLRAAGFVPEGSRQHRWLVERARASEARLPKVEAAGPQTAPAAAPAAAAGGERRGGYAARGGAALGALGLLAWKLKAVLAFVLAKGKFLLAGLTKASTFFSMLLSLGVYWTQWGWMLALGLIVSMYVHEMGHVASLARYGIPATPPMFVPGLGAFVRLKAHPASAVEDARVGLAGPVWGLGAALVAYAVHLATGAAVWAAIARVGAWINLFNLLPVWQLDGGRAFRSLNRPQRWLAVLALFLVWTVSAEGLLVLLLIAGAGVALAGTPAAEPDRTGLLLYVGLVVALSALTMVVVPVAGI